MKVSKISKNYARSVSDVINLDFTVDQVWNIISKKSNLELFHPFCKKNPAIIWTNQQRKDEIHYINGFILQRQFISWKKNVGYDLVIGNKKHKMSFVSWRIKDFKNKSSLSIAIYPYIYNMKSRFYDNYFFELFIRSQLLSYLESVLGGLKWYLENNEPTPKNFFGSHKWFSKK
tara:strand:+ start:988 stop:1509 length:522 start_codon:yes stop_codon:yes gene_type:complete